MEIQGRRNQIILEHQNIQEPRIEEEYFLEETHLLFRGLSLMIGWYC